MSTVHPEPKRRIVRLTVSGFKKIIAADIHPPKGVVKVTGRNKQGKSSLLDSIAWALGGNAQLPDKPIHDGAEYATVVLESEDLIIKRGVTEDGSPSFVLEGPGGRSFPKPQSILDKLTNKRIFDPAEFIELDKTKRLELVQKLVGLDFTETDTEIKRVYDERTDVNRDLKRMETEAEALENPVDAPKEPLSTEAIDIEIAQADAVNEAANKLTAAHGHELARVTNAQTRLSEIEGQVAELEKQLTDLRGRAENGRRIVATLQLYAAETKAKADAAPRASVAALTARRDQIRAANDRFNKAKERREAFEAVKRKRAESEEMTRALEHLEKTKKDALKAAKFPVPGMSFSSAGVLLNDKPFEQASAMEQRYASVGMAAALDPAFRVMLLRDASLLDSEAIADFTKLAEQFDLQLWLEIVSDGEKQPGAILVEDGRIVSET